MFASVPVLTVIRVPAAKLYRWRIQCFCRTVFCETPVRVLWSAPLREGTRSARPASAWKPFERAVKCVVRRSAPATRSHLVEAPPRTRPLLAIQGFPQVHHGDFGVAVDCGDGGVQAGLGQSAERHAEELETPLES